MKLGMDHIGPITDEKLKFLQQMGVEGIMGSPEIGPNTKGYHEYNTLLHLKTRVEAFDMVLACIGGNTPWDWNYKWMLGLDGRDEQISNIQTTIRNMGAVGIPVYTYNIHALRFYRTSSTAPLRGGAQGTSFDADLVKNAPLYASTGANVDLIPEADRKPVTDDELWANLSYFLEAVLPVAEEAGVKLGLHPDDPQVPVIGGVARIMRSPEAFRRVIEMVPSDSNGLLFCVGCFTEMGANVPNELRYFTERGKIHWVHFRNTKGTTEKFFETFADCGDTDMYQAAKALHEAGYQGYLTPDHRIRVEGDSDWGHRYWAYGLGYNKAVMMSLRSELG